MEKKRYVASESSKCGGTRQLHMEGCRWHGLIDCYCLDFWEFFGQKAIVYSEPWVLVRPGFVRGLGLKAFVAAIFAASLTPATWAGFIIEDLPQPGGSWSQRIVLDGSFDAIAFEIVSGAAGPGQMPGNADLMFGFAQDNSARSFAAPGISDFTNPSAGGVAIGGWNAEIASPSLVVAFGLDTSSMAVTLHFAGDVDQPVTFRGVAFQDGEFQFSATFVWDGAAGSGIGSGFINIIDVDGWQPEPGSLGMVLIPLPAPVWLGSIGLLAVIVLRRKLH